MRRNPLSRQLHRSPRVQTVFNPRALPARRPYRGDAGVRVSHGDVLIDGLAHPVS
jgi:hypothetical protein